MEITCYHATWCPFCRAFIGHYRSLIPDGREKVLDSESDPAWVEMGIEYVPTVIESENGVERRRLSARPGVGITKEMLVKWMGE